MKNHKLILKRLELKRFRSRLRSKYIRKLRRGGKIDKLKAKKLHLYRKISHYKKIGTWSSQQKRNSYNITVPKIFDLSTEPELVLDFIDKLKKDLNHEAAYNIHIDHSKTERINLDASYLFDKIIKDYSEYWRKLHIKIKISGTASDNIDVNNFLLSFGLLAELNIINHQLFPNLADRDYTSKYITYKKYGTSYKNYLAGNASTELVNYFDSCFRENQLRIKEDAKSSLVDCFGEIIKNAEEHSGKKPTEWVVLGCYTKSNHSCSFSIINYGNSFYESLADNKSTAQNVLKEVAAVIYNHNSFINKLMLNRELYEQAIYTYMAIQDGISSKRSESGKASTRGQGIMDVMQFIDQIRNKNNQKTHLSIISGNTFLNIDYKYPLVEKKKGENQEIRRIMYLNNENSFSALPDLKKLKSIKSKFPGVIFSGYFIIDHDYLISQMRSA
jgi:hypothetical protein